MIPIGSWSSRTKGRLVMERAFPVVGYCVAGQNPCRTPHPVTPYPTTGNGNGRGGLGSLRHVYRRVELTLRLRGGEAGTRLGAAASDDFPPAVLRLQRLRRERNDLRGAGTREDDVHAAGAGPAHGRHERVIRIEPPMGRSPLRGARRAVLLTPPRERRQAQASRDDAVHVFEQQHLGEQVLSCRARLQLAHRLVADLEQLLAAQGVLVLLDPLQQELVVLLLE